MTQAAGDSVELFSAIWGQWFYYGSTCDCEEAYKLSEHMLRLAESSGDNLLLSAAHYALGFVYEIKCDIADAVEHSAAVIRLIPEMANHRSRVARFVLDPAISARGAHARVCGLLGYPAQCKAEMDQLLILPERHKLDPRSVCDIVISACMCHEVLGSIQQILELSEHAVDLARKYELVLERQGVLLMRGWALAMSGSLEEGIAEMRSCRAFVSAVGNRMFMETMSSAYLAEALLLAGELDEARELVQSGLDFAASHRHRYFEAELLRMGGQVAVRAGNVESAQSWFMRAIECARRQRARGHELRAAIALGRLLSGTGEKAEARTAVSSIYEQFTDGFETADLRSARELLEQL